MRRQVAGTLRLVERQGGSLLLFMSGCLHAPAWWVCWARKKVASLILGPHSFLLVVRCSIPVEQLFQMPSVTHAKTWYSLDFGEQIGGVAVLAMMPAAHLHQPIEFAACLTSSPPPCPLTRPPRRSCLPSQRARLVMLESIHGRV